MGVAGQRQRGFGLGAGERDFRAFATQCSQTHQAILQPQAGGDQHLVVAAAAGVDLAAGVAEAFDQPRLDRRMAVLVALVEYEATGTEVVGQRLQFAPQAVQLAGIEYADLLQALGMRTAGLDVEQEEFAVEDHVLAGEETLDAFVDLDAGFLP